MSTVVKKDSVLPPTNLPFQFSFDNERYPHPEIDESVYCGPLKVSTVIKLKNSSALWISFAVLMVTS